MKQFITVVAISFAFLTVAILGGLWYFDPLGFAKPSDSDLTSAFLSHRQTFDQLRELALSDKGKVWNIEESNLDELPFSANHRKAYRILLGQLGHCNDIGIDQYEIRFICGSGGFGTISREWAKGISYLPEGPGHVGKVVKILDPITKEGEVFLRPIGGGWYLFYQDIN